MKRLVFLMLMVMAVAVSAQKKQKPNINKALKSLQEGQLAEAKETIDAARPMAMLITAILWMVDENPS